MAEGSSKICSKCKETKELVQFAPKRPECRFCGNIVRALWKAKNKDRLTAYKAEWYMANKERTAPARRAWREQNRDKVSEQRKKAYTQNPESYKKRVRDYRRNNSDKVAESSMFFHLKKKYGMSPDDYQILLKNQGGVCAICKGPPTGTGKKNGRYYVDHDHNTGAIRGLLCHGCNTGIGHLKDSKEVLVSAIAYLEKAGK